MLIIAIFALLITVCVILLCYMAHDLMHTREKAIPLAFISLDLAILTIIVYFLTEIV